MRILLTGATGFVGLHLVESLNKCGISPVCLVRHGSSGLEKLRQYKAEIRIVDLKDESKLGSYFANIDLVYHLAASVFSHNTRELNETNVQLTQALYKALKGSGVKKFIFLSSIAAVGGVPLNEVISEKTIEKPFSLYGKSKFRAEQELRRLQLEVKIDVIVIRAPIVYGEGMSANSRLRMLINKLLSSKMFTIGNGSNRVSLCQIQNLIDLLIAAGNFESSPYEIFHIADPESMTFNQLIHVVSISLKRNHSVKRIPIRLALVIAFILDFLHWLTLHEFELTLERVREWSGNWAIDLSKVRKWGFSPREDWHQKFFEVILKDLKES